LSVDRFARPSLAKKKPAHRGRSVGVYYTVRNLLVVPAGVVGGILWQRSPALPLEAAFLVAAAGAVAYLVTSRGDRDRETAQA
jgi:hypothetical protein